MPPFVKVIIITLYADKLMRRGLREAQVGDVCQDLYGLFCSIALARVREKNGCVLGHLGGGVG